MGWMERRADGVPVVGKKNEKYRVLFKSHYGKFDRRARNVPLAFAINDYS